MSVMVLDRLLKLISSPRQFIAPSIKELSSLVSWSMFRLANMHLQRQVFLQIRQSFFIQVSDSTKIFYIIIKNTQSDKALSYDNLFV